MDMTTIGERLKKVREERNVSIAELSEALGLNKTTIYRYETGAFKRIKPSTLGAIAEYLGVNPDYLIGASDVKHTAKEAERLIADITDDEKMLLEMFRLVPVESQRMVLDMIKIALKHDQ